ncbi:DUF4097 family beta strand repeat-containing protein [Chryseolinea sp. T2]|uniref:DUF4097 family beta strand repeat-containing protein n=1 Tax=Chryseolinea sp. T2 TaxID=3129255 RepID=UPI0030774937
MKKQTLITTIILVITALTTIAFDTLAQNSNEFTVPLSDPAKRGKLKAHINYGSISVKGTARKDILVRYKAADDGEDSKESTKNGLKKIGSGGIDFEVAESDNNVKVSSNSWNKKLMLEVEVPSGIDLDVKTYNDGDLVISNIQGETVLTNYNGEITATNISGSVMATTYNGDIKVTFDKVTAGTPMSYSTYNGDIDIALPATHKASLKMKTEQGDIFSDFDVAFKNTGPVQQKKTDAGVYKVIVDEWKRGDINGGGPELTIKNYNGDIFIRRK